MKNNKEKIIFLNNHFQYSDGTVRALIGLVNNLDPDKYDITIKPIYLCDKRLKPELRQGIKLEEGFGFYFKGFDKIVRNLPLKWLYRKFINGKYDIEVGFQFGVPTLLVGNSMNNNAAHIIWTHGYDSELKYQDCYLKADRVVCVSKYNALRFKHDLNDKIKVDYCYNIVDDKNIFRLASEPINIAYAKKPLLVSVGRHSPEKGYLRLINILHDLHNEGYLFTLLLVGDGPEHKKIKQRISELGMGDCIILTGSTVNPHKYTSKADVFVCSSLSEGYSTACTEAAILGIPILTTDVAGGQEIIEEAECGMLVGLDDKSLKDGLRIILGNPNILSKWKQKAQATSYKFKLRTRKQAVKALFNDFDRIKK